MLTIYSDEHIHHFAQSEIVNGTLQPCFECPSRAETILRHIRQAGLGEITAPGDSGLEPILKVHSSNYLTFLRTAWARWTDEGGSGDLMATSFIGRHGRADVPRPKSLVGELGYYSFDTEAPITHGTWRAIYNSAQVAITAADSLKGSVRSAFALCRPPGHHCGTDFMGGYCYLNNAAIAAQRFISKGAKRIAILDLDYHHGNGTQQIFYERDDVLFLSIHGDPVAEYPYFWGHASERGDGRGKGCNLNLPLPSGADWSIWSKALITACQHITHYAPDVIVVSLGVDTFVDDPISEFVLESTDYLKIGQVIADLGVPTLFVMEGGYAVEAIGINVVNVLRSFEQRVSG